MWRLLVVRVDSSPLVPGFCLPPVLPHGNVNQDVTTVQHQDNAPNRSRPQLDRKPMGGSSTVLGRDTVSSELVVHGLVMRQDHRTTDIPGFEYLSRLVSMCLGCLEKPRLIKWQFRPMYDVYWIARESRPACVVGLARCPSQIQSSRRFVDPHAIQADLPCVNPLASTLRYTPR